ncbi:hypothetical protein MANES_18G086334v8 [Manihot esculenta]|uniref:Uncharacterized protein n=1 Tax=Manihot esculenta TaxID=3983 RepID=A0ACB7FZK5_MANES|nr:hypothetical protein MANES_18G086334v8 [Manihot esculenta]
MCSSASHQAFRGKALRTITHQPIVSSGLRGADGLERNDQTNTHQASRRKVKDSGPIPACITQTTKQSVEQPRKTANLKISLCCLIFETQGKKRQKKKKKATGRWGENPLFGGRGRVPNRGNRQGDKIKRRSSAKKDTFKVE